MAYSRWSNSRWHTIWSGGQHPAKNKQVFEVCEIKRFEYAVVKKDPAACAESCRDIPNEAIEDYTTATDKQVRELERYMRKWLSEVDEHYDKKGRRKKTRRGGRS